MGIIKKQSITGTIYLYIGVVLGFVTTGIVFPNFLTTDEVGLLRLLLSVALMVSQFAGLGFHSPTARLFPFFRDKSKGHNGFLSLSLTVSLGGFIVFVTALLLIKPWVVANYQEKSALFVEYFYYLIPLIFFKLLFNTFDNYCKVLYNAVIGTALKDVWQRVFILITVSMYALGFIDFDVLITLYVISIGLPPVIMIIYLIKAGEFHLRSGKGFIDSGLAKTMVNMSLFGILNGFSGIMILNVDVLMINHYLDLSSTGIYAVTMFFGTLVNMPARSIKNIASVVIADAWKEDNRELIADIYRKSSIVLTTIGLLIIVGLWSNINNVFRILSTDYQGGVYVILLIGIANLIDMSVSVSKNIINNSQYYRYMTCFILMFFILIVLTNIVFIPVYGITGAALATVLSKLIYNFVIFLFLKIKFGFQPFTLKHLFVICIALFSYYTSTLLPDLGSFFIDFVIRSSVVVVLYGTLVYTVRISSDINRTVESIFVKIFGK